MEEDIKILEDFINNEFQKDKLEMNEKGGFKIGTIYKVTELSPAIENLIKGYRELEERIIYLVNERKKLEELLFASNKNYIEKSKVKEKMEEVKIPNIIVGGRRNCKTLEYGKKLGKLEVLQELMEDK